jgi:hypothetical protein
MLISLQDLPSNAKAFAHHCLKNFSLRELVDMINSDKQKEHCAEFQITEEQWQDAVYVVIKEMGR